MTEVCFAPDDEAKILKKILHYYLRLKYYLK